VVKKGEQADGQAEKAARLRGDPVEVDGGRATIIGVTPLRFITIFKYRELP
jgi:hypothetical protein